MISLKRNSKGELVNAPGIRKRSSSIYKPHQTESFKISRSKFNDFLTCQRCFYLDRVRGLISPSTPSWTLNETTDLLLKKEFDACREDQTPHRLFSKFNLNHVVPYAHPDLVLWRDSLRHGLEHQIKGTNIILHGGIDDVWLDTRNEEIIVVDYKSQANNRPVTPRFYLAGTYHQAYKTQLDVYAYLFQGMGFHVSPTSYFYVVNAKRDADGFHAKMEFQETLVPYNWSSDWIEPEVQNMQSVLDSEIVPPPTDACENCAYANQRNLVDSN
ncbi:PD-(D/E)XK nuclease family protein [Dehalococcoidia bacterium]|nr:PD-(D/E)XK nuclease family protein [Dehalococcoidia bacterium]